MLDPSTRVWRACEKCAAAPLLTRTVAVGLECAYISDAGTGDIGDEDLRILGVSVILSLKSFQLKMNSINELKVQSK